MLSKQIISEIKKQIDNAQVVSFDVFDTLLFRKVNTPEDVFELIGKKYAIPSFCKIRVEGQRSASQQLAEKFQYPHANFDEIYDYIANHYSLDEDIETLKQAEIKIESEMLAVNAEIKELYDYAISIGKRVIAVTDMYFSAEQIRCFLVENGYDSIAKIYCSADERKAKFDGSLFPHVIREEKIASDQMVHIGDNQVDDYLRPLRYGITCFHYDSFGTQAFSADGTIFDKGIFKILTNKSDDFWYNLGVKCGGPIYLGLYRWLEENGYLKNRKLICMARDGYNLFHLLQPVLGNQVDYFHTSRRALLLAGIGELDDVSVNELPPYTYGQTLHDIFEFLDIDERQIEHLQDKGFVSFDDRILTDRDFNNVKTLLKCNANVLLKKCEEEREELSLYMKKQNISDSDTVYFDCGWSGSSQFLLERALEAMGKEKQTSFLYFGIQNTEKSKRQLNGKTYRAFAFDPERNLDIQKSVSTCALVYELFFGAPEGSTLYYRDGEPVLNDEYNGVQKSISKGILDFVSLAKECVANYQLAITPQQAIAQVNRLINDPTVEEATMIGNLCSTDTFSQQKGEKKYFAYLTEEQFRENPRSDVFWLNGFFKRKDIPKHVKQGIAKIRGINMEDEDKVQYFLENHADINRYLAWHDKQVMSEVVQGQNVFFSVVMPVYNTISTQLRKAIDSVLAQTYSNYELILVDDCSTWESVRADLKEYEGNEKVHIIYRKSNGHISEATNDGIAAAKGDYIAFMDCDDYIEPAALNEFALYLSKHPEMDFVYSDEDKATEDGKILHLPFFKPDWSPDLFMSEMYTNHLAIYRTEIVKKIGGLRTKCNGAQDYDMTLRFMEHSSNERVGHIAKVLYHWRERKESVAFSLDSKDYATEATRIAKTEALERRGIDGYVEYVPTVRQYHTVYNVVGTPFVSIIIPSKDNYVTLHRCVESIFARTHYQNYEIVIVDNGSSVETQQKVRQMCLDYDGRVQYVYEASPFNFSHMCNLGVQHAKGEFVLLLNDDTEVLNGKWLERMLGHAQQKHVGAVGAKLLYPNSTIIQHAGVSMIEAGPSHHFMASDDIWSYYFATTHLEADYFAVTGACLLVSKANYQRVHGLDENLSNDYNDIDFCIKLHESGLYNVVRSDAILFHYESLSRKAEEFINEERRLHAWETMKKNHPAGVTDPFFNPNLKNKTIHLDIENVFDDIRCLDISTLAGVRVVGEAHIDRLEVSSDGIHITGWNSLSSERLANDYSKRMLVIHSGGMNYCVDVHTYMREDMANWSGNLSNISIGFECKVQDRVKTINWYECDYGILSVLNNGEHIYTPVELYKPEPAEHIMQKDDMCKEAQRFKNVLVYGAGVYGKRCVAELLAGGIKPSNVVVSNLEGNMSDIDGIGVTSYSALKSSIKKDDTLFIVALKAAYAKEVIPMLKEDGVTGIYNYVEKIMV